MALYVKKLTEVEKEELKKSLRSQNAIAQRRARILLWSWEGQKAPHIAQRLGVHINTVRRCIKAFNHEGLASISPKPKSGRKRQFGEELADNLVYLLHQSPSQYGLETGLWTLTDLKNVAESIGLVGKISYESIRRVLRRCGHSWKKAKGWIHSPDPEYLVKKTTRFLG